MGCILDSKSESLPVYIATKNMKDDLLLDLD